MNRDVTLTAQLNKLGEGWRNLSEKPQDILYNSVPFIYVSESITKHTHPVIHSQPVMIKQLPGALKGAA